MITAMVFLMLLLALIAFDLAAWRWGYDSREPFASNEWERRHTWRH